MNKNPWRRCADELPPLGSPVDTKIDDEKGVRNETPLFLRGQFWWVPSGKTYVYYRPTHWRMMAPGKAGALHWFPRTARI